MKLKVLAIAVTSATLSSAAALAQPVPKPLAQEAAEHSTMPLPALLRSNVSVIAVAEARSRRHPLEFPPYAVARLDRRDPNADDLRTSKGQPWLSAIDVADHYSFVLREGKNETWKAGCLSGHTATTIANTPRLAIEAAADERTVVQCVLDGPGAKRWSLEFEGAMSSNFLLGDARTIESGRLTDGQRTLVVRPSFRPDSFVFTGPGALGYLIGDRERPLAAVEIVRPGRLIVADSVDANDRSLFASVAAAMMLQSDAGQ